MGPYEDVAFTDPRPPRPAAPVSDDPLDAVFTWPAEEWTGRRRTGASAEELDEVFGVTARREAAAASARGAAAAVAVAEARTHAGQDATADPGSDDRAPEDAAPDAAPAGAAAPDSAAPDEGALSAPVRALMAAVAAVRVQLPAELPEVQALTETSVLLGQLEQLRAVVLARLADVDRRRLHTLADARSAGSWVAGQSSSLTRTELAFARRLAVFPTVAAAVETGRMSIAVASRVAAALVKARRHLDRPDELIDGQPAEPTLRAVIVDGVLSLLGQACGGLPDTDPRPRRWQQQLTAIADSARSQQDRLTEAFLLLAQHLSPADLPAALNQLLDALLPLELERRGQDGHDQRGLRLRRKHDGSGWLISRGELDLECGELLHTVLTAELTTDPDNPTDTAAYAAARQDGWQPDLDDQLPSDSAGGPRTLDQRRHDALKNGLRRYLDAGITGLRDKIAPHLNVTITLGALHHAPGALPPVAATGTSLPRSLVHSWWCDSTVTRFVLSLGHQVIETSHTERTLKPHERRASKVQTGGLCQATTCRRGPATGQRLIPHHANPWATHGTTSYTDTVPLCEQDHHHLHTGHPLRLKDGRRLGPHGWLTDHPPRPGPEPEPEPGPGPGPGPGP